MEPIVIEQNKVRFEINPLVLLNNMLRPQPQVKIEDYINYRSSPYHEWAIQFFNNQNLSTLYVQQWFSYFGHINSVVQRRHSPTMYVNFANECDARRCVVAMMNQNYIQLRPFQKNYSYSNSFPQQNGFNNVESHRTQTHRNTALFSGFNHQKNLRNFVPLKNDVIDGDQRNVNNMNVNSMESSVLFEASENTSEDSSIKNCSCQCSQAPDQLIDKIDDNNHSDTISARNDEDLDSKIIAQNREKPEERVEQKSKEALMESHDKARQIITAQEVIVGNIDEAYGVPYILHLLEKYQPICISDIKTVWNDSLRYCHVYFETPAHAEAAETNYDEVELNGKKLIVLRPHRLAVQAMQK